MPPADEAALSVAKSRAAKLANGLSPEDIAHLAETEDQWVTWFAPSIRAPDTQIMATFKKEYDLWRATNATQRGKLLQQYADRCWP